MSPIQDLSTAQWDGSCGLLSPRRAQRKAWIYGGVMDARFMIGFAIADAGWLSTAFVYVYDRMYNKLTERKATRLLAFDSKFAPTPQAIWHLHNGQDKWQIEPLNDRAGWSFSFSSPALDVAFELTDTGHAISALNNAPSKIRTRPFHYTHKLAGLPAKTNLTLNDEHYNLRHEHHGVLDFTLGYPPRSTLWQWACWVGTLDDGRPFSCNLVAQTMNGLENTAWMHLPDGSVQVLPLAQAVFNYNPNDTLKPWHIHTADGRLDMQFMPDGARSETIHMGVMYSAFTQPFGRLIGTWLDEDGSIHSLAGFGVVEQHRALW